MNHSDHSKTVSLQTQHSYDKFTYDYLNFANQMSYRFEPESAGLGKETDASMHVGRSLCNLERERLHYKLWNVILLSFSDN